MVATFENKDRARKYRDQSSWEFPVLMDNDRQLYRDFTRGKGNLWAIAGPRAIWKYMTLMLQGHSPGTPGNDYWQLGGDIIIRPSGEILLEIPTDSPPERP
ncbi:MAG: peroxiredoxin-like family protein, partial [Planctomycetota bacterium]